MVSVGFSETHLYLFWRSSVGVDIPSSENVIPFGSQSVCLIEERSGEGYTNYVRECYLPIPVPVLTS